ncbi:MAG TPA: O-antigen ligase family protein [Vicinamibacterales bacterium]
MNASPIVWRSRWMRLALAALPCWFTFAVLVLNTTWTTKLIVGGVFLATVLSPGRGLVVVAALVPLGRLLEALLNLQPFRVSEALVLAFLAGWLIKGDDDRSGPRVPSTAAWMLAAIAAMSGVAQAIAMARDRPEVLTDSLQTLFQAYYLIPDQIGFGAAATLIEGLALAAAVATLVRRAPRLTVTLPAAVTVGATAAALSSVFLARGIGPAAIVAEQARFGPRISAFVGDVNAAASYFVMTMFVALGMAVWRRRPSSALWVAAAFLQVVALILTRSRTGVAVAIIVFGVAGGIALVARWKPAARLTAIAALLVVALVAGLARYRTLQHDPGNSFRQQFFSTSLRMIAARPIAGVGVGRYYEVSSLFLTPEMAWVYGTQNAHNYFLQIAGELGLAGLVLFLAFLWAVLARAMRALVRRSTDWRLLGCTAGVAALLATCLTGHPLLLDEVNYTFWIVFGLAGSLAGSVLLNDPYPVSVALPHVAEESPRWRPAACIVVLTTVGAAQIYSASKWLTPPAVVDVDGLEPWAVDGDGTRYRWTHGFASFFVSDRATRVYIPVRLPFGVSQISPMRVEVSVAGSWRQDLMVGSSWDILNIEIPPSDARAHFKRINLKMQRTWQPAIYVPGSHDMREVGVEVGELKPFYEY